MQQILQLFLAGQLSNPVPKFAEISFAITHPPANRSGNSNHGGSNSGSDIGCSAVSSISFCFTVSSVLGQYTLSEPVWTQTWPWQNLQATLMPRYFGATRSSLSQCPQAA